MPGLHEAQRLFVTALLTGESEAAAGLIAAGQVGDIRIAAADRLRIHRNTMLAALANALKLSFPAVSALVGEAFFEQAAHEFAKAHPPRSPLLSLYGSGFAAFLSGYAPAAGLRYLPDVARLEWTVECAAFGPEFEDAPPAGVAELGTATLALAPSLLLLRTDYPAEAIWRAALNGDEGALGAIDPSAKPATLAIWRDGDGAEVAALSPLSAAFLQALVDGADAETALTAAAEADPTNDPISVVAAEVLAAGFSRLTPH